MKDKERIEESHGLWELAIARLAALVEAGAAKQFITAALQEERRAFRHWQLVSDSCTH